jgi:DNA-binding beta-propeller fold protein YncE
MPIVTYSSRWFIITTLSCLCFFSLAPITVQADGGAPNRAYIAGATKGIAIIDILQQKVINHMAIPGDPHTILLSLDGNYLYVTEPQLQRVAIIRASTGATLCTAPVPGHPTLLAMDNANLLFAASNDASSITALDPNNCQILHIFQLNQPVYGIGVASIGTSLSSGNQLWVTTSTELTAFDDINASQIKQISIPDGPRYISIPPGTAAYLTTQLGSVVTVDLKTYNVRTLISGGIYGPMDFDEGTSEVYVPDQKSHQLVVLQPAYGNSALPHEPLRTIPLEARPISVAVTSDGQLAFVALEDGKVAMLDIPAHHITNTFDVGGDLHFIITGLNPPTLSPPLHQAQTSQQSWTLQIVLLLALCGSLIIILVIVKMRSKNIQLLNIKHYLHKSDGL